MKDWIEKKLKENSANNVIIFPLREEDVERKLRNIQIDKELKKEKEEENDNDKE
ncbi:hypothetical protein HX858_09060 [Marine Group I thaumarchaeote]|uniref:Uncharacterized protein n=1 Tax=Marine Group I thaumarchaeote TaxID=2511932 RepID=A0A7K4MWI8_9ARCH|nr:hypothetical protein [Marine Group I thaumarchaeote]